MSAESGRVLLFASLLVSSTLATSCGGDDRTAHPLAPDRPTSGRTVTGKPADPADIGAGHVDGPPLPPLVDRPAVYDPADTGPVDVSVTVTDEQAFAAVKSDLAGAKAPIRFEAAGYDAGGAVTNGTIELRGSTTRSAPQKSYQIKLSAGAAPWRGSHTINLLKHPFDLTRVRNTLSFELFRRITGFTSLRTGFVHLFINAVDQGLYEWVEEPDERFPRRARIERRRRALQGEELSVRTDRQRDRGRSGQAGCDRRGESAPGSRQAAPNAGCGQ